MSTYTHTNMLAVAKASHVHLMDIHLKSVELERYTCRGDILTESRYQCPDDLTDS